MPKGKRIPTPDKPCIVPVRFIPTAYDRIKEAAAKQLHEGHYTTAADIIRRGALREAMDILRQEAA